LAGLTFGTGNNLTNAIAGTHYVAPGGALGTPSSGNLQNCTGIITQAALHAALLYF
jgi:hypothetical protein